MVWCEYTLSYRSLLDSKKSIDLPPEIQDFRQKTIDPTPQAKNYNDGQINIATRLGIGDPGSRTNEHRKYLNDDNDRKGQDKVNMIPLYTNNEDTFTNKFLSKLSPAIFGKNPARDMIKFAFEVISNDNSSMTTKVHL